MADIAVLQSQIGEKAAAAANFARARELVGANTAELRELAWALARAGDLPELLALTSTLPQELPNWRNPDFRDVVLSECARELAKELKIDLALAVTQQIENAKRKISAADRARRSYIQALIKAGKVHEAQDAMNLTKDPTQKIWMLAGTLFNNFTFMDYPQEPGIAVVQARTGERAAAEKSLLQARALLRDIPEDKRSYSTAAIVGAYAQLGDLENAGKLLKEVPKGPYRSFATAAYIKALGVAGKTKEAEELLSQLEKGDLAHALYHYAVGQNKSGDPQGAKRSLARSHKLLDDEVAERGIHEHNLISAQALAGDAAGAVASLKGNTDESVRISNIVYALTLAHDYEFALKVAKRIADDAWWRGNCLRAIAKSQAQNGKEADALIWIKALSSANDKSNGLLGVAEGLAQRGGN